VAGHGAEQFVDVRLDTVTGAVLHQVRQDVGHQPVGLGLLEQRGNLADRQRFRAQALQFKTEFLEHAGVLFGTIGFALADRQGFRHQQRLAARASLAMAIFRRSYMIRSWAACMSTSTRPWAFSARM